jgi:acyl-CoA synthetase (NDP forming)
MVSPDIPHKSDAGGVLIGLNNAEEVSTGFKEMMIQFGSAVPGATIEGVLVGQQAFKGLHLIVGALEGPVFGPAIMFDLRGIFTDVIQDISFRLVPLNREDAEGMIREIRGYSLLNGARGQASYNINELTELLLSLSRMIAD